jgi:hypothetical protein
MKECDLRDKVLSVSLQCRLELNMYALLQPPSRLNCNDFQLLTDYITLYFDDLNTFEFKSCIGHLVFDSRNSAFGVGKH